jgi:two-component system response regulator HydG
MTEERILIVDDDANHRLMLRGILSGEGYATDEAEDGQMALQKVEKGAYDLALLDLKMPRMDGMEALTRIRQINPALPVLIMTAYASVDTAVEAIKLGAYDYLSKPLDTDEVLNTIAKTLRRFQPLSDAEKVGDSAGEHIASSRIIGKSKEMEGVFELLALASPSDATILITGESGTGKELVARAVHDNSPRKDKPFVVINSVAIPANLLESELFGYEKGAFTGAAQRHLGKFEQANGGTIFFDEIGDMPEALQAKLLRVLQEREIERLGGKKPISVDVRVIAATNREMETAVAAGKFREDLYFRLSVVPISLPPLRKRREDIPVLAEHFLTQYGEKNQRLLRGFTPGAMSLISRYPWPGNVRELENAIERAAILCRGEFVNVECLPRAVQNYQGQKTPKPVSQTFYGTSLKEVEKELIIKTLEQTEGNRTETARILGISRQTLHNRLREYGIL